MRDFKEETERRVAFIREILAEAHATGIVYGNSGGKDSTLVGALCKAACADTVGIILPCASSRNFGSDLTDALAAAKHFGIETRTLDLTAVRGALKAQLETLTTMNDAALSNIAPRLRMTALYAVAAAEGRLVAGTGNRSEIYIGYFTKWGDWACDFNPIADLTATEVFAFLEFLGAPRSIIDKAPSAGLYEGQTDEQEMGITYASIDGYLLHGTASPEDHAVIERYHVRSGHKRAPGVVYMPAP